MKTEDYKKHLTEDYKKHLKEEAEKFRLSSDDLSNLYDLLNIADTPKEIEMDFRGTLKTNNLDKWFKTFLNKIEKIVVPEI